MRAISRQLSKRERERKRLDNAKQSKQFAVSITYTWNGITSNAIHCLTINEWSSRPSGRYLLWTNWKHLQTRGKDMDMDKTGQNAQIIDTTSNLSLWTRPHLSRERQIKVHSHHRHRHHCIHFCLFSLSVNASKCLLARARVRSLLCCLSLT